MTPGHVLFWPQGHYLNKLIETHQVMLHIKYHRCKPYGFGQEDVFNVFPYISLCKQCDPGAGPFLTPGA